MAEEGRRRLADYARLLATWPGLVSAQQREHAQELVDDCLVLLDHLGEGGRLIDVGSGGGMPGIPLKIVRPDLAVTLLETERRKAAFCEHAAAVLDLGLTVLAARAEEVGRGSGRESFDLAVCRALGAMPVVAELCLPLLRTGGRLLAMKTGPRTKLELVACAEASRLLGGGPPQIVSAGTQARREGIVISIDKLSPTPDRFPRRPGVPARRPLVAGHATDTAQGK